MPLARLVVPDCHRHRFRFRLGQVCCAALLGLIQGCSEQASTTLPARADTTWELERIDQLQAAMPGLMRHYSVPGVAVALVSGGHIQWSSGFGVVALGKSDVTSDSVFQAASLGKPVFAEIFHLEVGDSSWSLDDPVGELAAPGVVPDRFLSAAGRQLLSHTSGLVYDPEADLLAIDEARRGSWQYSGAGYQLLQTALESATQQTLEQLAQRRVFAPLGLHNTTFAEPTQGIEVTGHSRNGKPLARSGWPRPDAASSLHTSATDYARFLVGMMHRFRDPLVRADMLEPLGIVDQALALSWGLGWAIEHHGDAVVAFHWGSNPGFKSLAFADLERDMGLVILTNGDNGLELIEQAVSLLDPVTHPMFDFYMMHPDD